jgi:hypothetical protein
MRRDAGRRLGAAAPREDGLQGRVTDRALFEPDTFCQDGERV